MYVVPENINAHPKKGQWKFRGGGGRGLRSLFKETFEAKLKFPGGRRVQIKIPSVGLGEGSSLDILL